MSIPAKSCKLSLEGQPSNTEAGATRTGDWLLFYKHQSLRAVQNAQRLRNAAPEHPGRSERNRPERIARRLGGNSTLWQPAPLMTGPGQTSETTTKAKDAEQPCTHNCKLNTSRSSSWQAEPVRTLNDIGGSFCRLVFQATCCQPQMPPPSFWATNPSGM